MRNRKIEYVAVIFVILTVSLLLAGYAWESNHTPKCTYHYDLQAGTIVANCPIQTAGLYSQIIAKEDGIYVTKMEQVADLHITPIVQKRGYYLYKFTVNPDYIGPENYVIVQFQKG